VKTLSMIVVATLFSTAAYAGDINESPIRGKGAISVVHNAPGAVQTGYTSEQINRALDYFGRPSLGTSRILHNDRDGGRDRETTKTYTESTITYHSGNK
jgi:hypothetical protein